MTERPIAAMASAPANRMRPAPRRWVATPAERPGVRPAVRSTVGLRSCGGAAAGLALAVGTWAGADIVGADMVGADIVGADLTIAAGTEFAGTEMTGESSSSSPMIPFETSHDLMACSQAMTSAFGKVFKGTMLLTNTLATGDGPASAKMKDFRRGGSCARPPARKRE